MIVAVDFDNTIIEPVKYPNKSYKLKEDCKEVLNRLSKKGYTFYINTSRYGWYFWSAVRFIKKNKLPIKIKLKLTKISADIYIDDRNLECKGIDWLEIEKIIIKEMNTNADK